MDVLHELAPDGAPAGTAVVAGEQTGGRGSRGRPWSSPPGGLWLSVLRRPARRPALELLSLRVGLAVSRRCSRPRLGSRRIATQVAERSHARRPEGRRDPVRGALAGRDARLGRGRPRAQRQQRGSRRAAPTVAATLAATRRRTSPPTTLVDPMVEPLSAGGRSRRPRSTHGELAAVRAAATGSAAGARGAGGRDRRRARRGRRAPACGRPDGTRRAVRRAPSSWPTLSPRR